MRAIAVAIALTVGLAAFASADVATVRQNLDKYWLCRERQRADFIEVGAGQGGSLPACWRNPDTHIIKWADTTIDLGWYIGALATEHYMLSHPDIFPGYASGGGDLNTVRVELYHALSAMDRLDSTAEICWDPLAPNTPGFFIRDDVPAAFHSNFPGMSAVVSDYTNPDIWAKEMSQDQVIHVLFGLSLVKRLIPSDLVVNGTNLRQAAINRGRDIVDWVHHDGWIIKNPVLGTDVVRGEDARSFSTGLNKTCVYLTDGATDFGGSISGLWSWVWSTLSSPTNPAYDNRNNLHMAMSLATTGNGWGNDTLDDLMSLSVKHQWYAYPMLYSILYDSVAQSRPTWAGHRATFNGLAQTMLNQAPAVGPHHPLNEGENNSGWCGSRKFIVTLDAQNLGEGEFTVGEWYNGLDYLVLHNLFYIVTPSLWQDPSPPADVISFSAAPGDNQVSLSWTNPSDTDFAGTMVRFKTTGHPTGPTDGALVVDKSNSPGSTDSFMHTGLANGATYYYRAFAHDAVPSYATGVDAAAVPTDTAPPAQLATFTVSPGNRQNALSWTNPGTPDFAGTMVRYRTNGYPASPTDGALVCNKTNSPGSADSFTHAGLTNGVTYYYSAFTYDEVPNYSSARIASGIPSTCCFADVFAYPDGNLNGNGGWTGTAASQISVSGQTVRITGSAGAYDSAYALSCTGGLQGVIEVRLQIRGGTGDATMWGLWIDDPSGNNMARWYGTAATAIGRIAGTASVTPTATLTGGWDNLTVRIYTLSNQSQFIFNGSLLGTLDHSVTGAGDTAGRVRFDRVDNGSASGHSIYLDNLWVGEGDATAPSPPTTFAATRGDTQVTLSWHNPSDADFTGTMIRYRTGTWPASITDGTLVIDKPNSPNSDDTCVHSGLTNGTTYYYAAFAHDGVLNYSTRRIASATPADTTAPGPVTGFSVVSGNTCNYLSWSNPADPDLAGVRILAKTTGYPSSPTDGSVVHTGLAASAIHASLTNGTTYYYAAYAYDEVPLYSPAAQGNASPLYFCPLQAKQLANGAPLTMTVGTVSAVGSNWLYAQCPDESCGPVGIRITKSGHGALPGQSICARGAAQTDPATGEKYIAATWVYGSGSGSAAPLGMPNTALGGSDWLFNSSTGAGQQGTHGGLGANNIGLLVRVWGRVTQRDTTDYQYFYIDDGSGLLDGTQTAGASNVGIRVKASPSEYAPGSYVLITGVSSCFKDASSNIRPLVIPATGGIQAM